MCLRTNLILLVLGAVCTCEAFQSLFPSEKEVIYKYNGVISASTYIPRLYTSSFILNGNLHIQKDDKSILAKFSNLTYQLYNGVDHNFESKTLPLSEELNDFYKVFRIDCEPSGKIAGIAIGANEDKYVINFKKAISSLLQLDLELIEKHSNTDSRAFHTYENSIYGKGKVLYNIESRNMSYYIDIMQEPQSTKEMYTHLLTNMEYDSPMSDYDEPISRDSQKRCVLSKHGNDKIIDSIVQTGGIYYQPFNAKSDAHAIYVNQTITFVQQQPITSKMQIDTKHIKDDLTYYTADLQNLDGALPDFTNGRRKWNKEILIKTAIDMFKELVKYVYNGNNIGKQPDLKKGQIVTRLTRTMLNFDQKMLAELREQLTKTDVDSEYLDGIYDNVYLQILPQLGTHAAYYQLKKIILGNKADSQDLAKDMFANVKYPNKKLVDDMSDMLDWKHEDDTVNGVAVLSFATLLHKSVERNRKYTNASFNPNNNLEEDFPDHKYYEKYIVEIVKKLKATNDYDEQILYLQALFNTKMESIVQHLLPAINGEWWQDSHLRTMAALAVSPIVTKNEDLTSEIYWPFMTNSNTSTSFRILAYLMIMKSKPSLPKLINIYWVMQSTENQELYQFHYKYLNEISQSENPHMKKFIVHINQILRDTYKPEIKGLTGYYQLDYFDNEYSFGEQATFLTIHSKLENEIIFQSSYQYTTNRLSATPYWIFLRFSGFHHSLLKDLKLDTRSTSNLFTNIWNAAMNLKINKNAKITTIIASNHHVSEIYIFKKGDFKLFFRAMKKFSKMFSYSDTDIDIENELSKTLILPTPMGFPAVFQSYIPNVDYSKIQIDRSDEDQITTINFVMFFKNWRYTSRGLSFYNPVLDVWQGVNKYIAYDNNADVQFAITLDRQEQSFKFSTNLSEIDNEDMIYSEASYATTILFINDDFDTNVLQKSNPKCNNSEIVSRGKEYQQNHVSHYYRMSALSTFFAEYVFDSEITNLKPYSFKDVDFRNLLKVFFKTEKYFEINPEPGNHGFIRVLGIDRKYPVSDVELILQYNIEYTKGDHRLLPAAQHNIRIRYSAGDGSYVHSSWIFSAKVDMNQGHTHNYYHLTATKIVGESEMKGCLDIEYVNTTDGFTSTFDLSRNVMSGTNCSDPLITVLFSGQKSEEQILDVYPYNSCLDRIAGPVHDSKSLQCFTDMTSLRKLMVNVSINSEQIDLNKIPKVDNIFGDYSKYADDSDKLESNQDIEANSIQAVIDFPMTKDVLNLKIFTENNVMSYKNIPNQIGYLGIPNTQYNIVFELMHRLALTDICVIQHDKLTSINGERIKYDLPTVWTLYLGAGDTGSVFSVWLKSEASDKLDIKVVYKSHSLLVESKTNKSASITVDGKTIEESQYSNDWIHYGWAKDSHVLSIFAEHYGCQIIYTGDQVQIEQPQMDNIEMHGKCLDKNVSV